ncbi:MAG: LLM class flavin-dependent oxidoreductase [Alphaproteobacteria bacterium]|nr:LLM class flavin-dependent oxidoreductase [Alphaproteobacteria bacterium]
MKVGLYVATQWPEGTDLGPQLGNLLEQVRRARAAGFKSLWAAHHYVVGPGMRMFQPTPLLARLAAEAEGMEAGPAILLLSMMNPVMVAEEAATLDWLTGGRYVLGVGIGYRQEEFAVTGVPIKERVGRFVESIELMRRLWREDRVSHKGRYFHLDDVGLSLRPVRPDGIPIWIGGSAEPAVRRAGEIGDGWLMSFSPSGADLVRLMAAYRQGLAASKRPPVQDMPLCRETYVGASNATALDEVRGPLLYKYQAYAAWGNYGVGPHAGRLAEEFPGFARDRFMIGDEAFVRDEIQRYRDQLGVNHLVLRMQWPGMDQALVLKSIERMGRIAATL